MTKLIAIPLIFFLIISCTKNDDTGTGGTGGTPPHPRFQSGYPDSIVIDTVGLEARLIADSQTVTIKHYIAPNEPEKPKLR